MLIAENQLFIIVFYIKKVNFEFVVAPYFGFDFDI